MPLIQATLLEGRTQDQKAAFCRDVSEAAAKHLDVKPAQVRVILYEVPGEHWSIGGVSKAELDKQTG